MLNKLRIRIRVYQISLEKISLVKHSIHIKTKLKIRFFAIN